MTQRIVPFIAVLLASHLALPLHAQEWHSLYINELMASNDQTIADGNGQNNDWVELYNPGPTPVVITGYYISDDPTQPMQHLLAGPDAAFTIPANGFLLLWASGVQSNGPTHLGFSLSASGESLYLTAPDGITAIDSLNFGPQLTDVSFGRGTDGAQDLLFFAGPTPGASNNTSTGSLGYLSAPAFSVTSGYFAGPFTVTISSADPDVEIYYSRDGSDPGPDRVGGVAFTYKNRYPEAVGQPFGPLLTDTMRAFPVTAPIVIGSTVGQPNVLAVKTTTMDYDYPPPYMPSGLVRKGTVIKARAYKEGFIPSPVVAHTYFITPSGTNPHQLPVVCLSTDQSNLFGYETGIYTAGADFDAWRTANPNGALWLAAPANWHRDTEHPVNLELFETQESQPTVSINTGFTTHGNWSLSKPRKSLGLYFRGNYGQNTLGHEVFPTQPGLDYRRLLIRNSGNDEEHTNLRDMSMQQMVRHMRFATQEARPAVLFLNGEFHGVHHLVERPDRHFIESKYGIQREDLDLLEIQSFVVEGSTDHYDDLMELVSTADVNQPEVYDDIRTRMDVDDFMDFYSATIFIGNTDWPHNNVKYFRKRTTAYEPNAPYAHDGRWRWMMYDTDFGFGYFTGRDASFNYLAWATSPTGNGLGSWATLLFRRLLLNSDFRNAFINRHADMLNTAYRTERTSGIINANRNTMAPDMAEHFPRWIGRPGSYGVWDFNIAVMHTFAQQRPGFARQEVLNQFNLPAMHTLMVDVSHEERGFVHVNTIDITSDTPGVDPAPYPWSGIYYQGVPVTLTATPLPGYVFLNWLGASTSTEPTITLDLTANTTVVAVFGVAEACEVHVVHAWDCNDLPSGALASVTPNSSMVPGALITYPGTGAGYLDRTPDLEGTEVNALPGILAGRALRVRNPSDTRELIIRAPSKGYRDVVFSFASMRTSNGAEEQTVYYTSSADQATWTILPPTSFVPATFGLRSFSLAGRTETYNNEDLAFRIVFSGGNAAGASGNNRFDNITLTGIPIPTTEVVLCPGDSYTFFGTTYDEPGSYLHVGSNPALCSNVQALDLAAFNIDTTVVVIDGILTVNAVSASYQWVNCNAGNAPIPGANEQSFEPGQNGSFAVTGVQDGCNWTSGCHSIINTGIVDPDMGVLQVFPNPTRHDLSVTVPAHLLGASYRLLDQTGRVIATGSLQQSTSTIRMEHLASGLYILEVPGTAQPPLRVQKDR